MRWKLKTFVLCIVIGLIALWALQTIIVSSFVSRSLGMNASFATVRITPTHVKMGYFTIANPEKYSLPYAFKADSIDCFYQWKVLHKHPAIIDRIEIDRIYLGIEFNKALSTQTNWSDLLKQIPERKKDGHEVIIKKLILTNVIVDIRGKGLTGGNQMRTIDRMEFANVSSAEGFPTEELIEQIFGKANLMDTIKDFVPKGPGGVIKKLIPFTINEKGPG